MIALKMPIVQVCDQGRASTFTDQKFISVKCTVHILFPLKDAFPKDLEPVLYKSRSAINSEV